MKLEINKNIDNLDFLIYSFQVTYNKKMFFLIKNELDSWMVATIKIILKKFPKILIKYEELIYFKDIYLLKNLLKFDSSLNIPFKTFLIKNLKWNFLTKLRSYITLNKQKINYSKEYDDNKHTNFHSFSLYSKNNYEDILYLLNLLSNLEKKVFLLKFKGYKLAEIVKSLNLDYKIISNALHRAKSKLKRYIIKNNLNVF